MQNLMPKHYLLAVGEGLETLPAGTLIADRYLLKQNCIVVDTRPEQFPEIPEMVPEEITPYLRLFPYRLHLPLLYGWISAEKNSLQTPIWLLEQGPIDSTQESFRPSLLEMWQGTSAVRQLNWLWQMAQLWHPFQHQQVASSLLEARLLRIEGSLVRLPWLQRDKDAVTLVQLGEFWEQLLEDAHPKLQKFLSQLSKQMIAREIRRPDELIYQIDQAMLIAGRSQTRRVEIITGTDTGPTRAHNEDASYPDSDTLIKVPANSPGLSIVCDGIGGQEGGEVASQLAIEVLREELENVRSHPQDWNVATLSDHLKQATNRANDVIAQRNDGENRQGRERMGTTLIMALTHEHEVYITHVGDSRAYWIMPTGCHQVTVDDDVASREVRLGYALYRDAIQPRSAGALIQALGIASSTMLYPTVQRFPVDEDCLFLLCSDGLSDKDRVESYWESEILPILYGEIDLISAKDRLIEIANTLNGHDNVTISLLHFRVSSKSGLYAFPEIKVPRFVSSSDNDAEGDTEFPVGDESEFPSTEFVEISDSKSPQIWLLSLGIAILLGLGGVLVYFWAVFDSDKPSRESQVSVPEPTQVPQPRSVPELPSPDLSLSLQSLIQLGENATLTNETSPASIQLLKEFEKPWIKGEVPEGTIVQIIQKQSTPEAGTWLELKICTLPTVDEDLPLKKNQSQPLDFSLEDSDNLDPSNTTESSEAIENSEDLYPLIQPSETLAENSLSIQPLNRGDTGWMRAKDVSNLMIDSPIFKPQQKGVCQDSQ
ncbi:MAG: protein phosphatase 2C domain-containing protein [Cyanobacteria bacterium J06592_8]